MEYISLILLVLGILIVLPIYLLVRVHILSSRISALEEQLSQTRVVVPSHNIASLPQQAQIQDKFDDELHRAIFSPQVEQQVSPTAGMTSTSAGDRFVAWLKEDWIIKIGAGLLLIGFGWLTTYAFLNNWIGPMGRITLGIAAGTAILLLGFWRIKTYIHQGGIFLVLGSTTILLTIFAAREIYNFFTPAGALAVMFMTTALVAFAAVRFNTQTLALASMVLAALAPFFTNSPQPNYEGLFIYLLMVTIGAVWIVALTGWRALTMASLVVISLYSLPHFFSIVHITDYSVLLLISFAFAAVFFATNTIGILRSKQAAVEADLVTAGGTGLFLLSWILIAGPDEWKSLLIAAWMLIFTIGAYVIFRKTGRREPFYVYAAVAIAMLGAATAQEAQGATLTFFYTIEALGVVIFAHTFLQDYAASEKLALLISVPMLLSGSSVWSPLWQTSILHKDFFVVLLLSIACFALGHLFSDWKKSSPETQKSTTGSVFYIIGSLYAFVLIWNTLHVFLIPDMAVMLSLIIYTIVGLALYINNVEHKKSFGRVYGGIILGLVILRLLTVDIWNMDITGKIVTFFLIGALLMSTAFIGRKKLKIENP